MLEWIIRGGPMMIPILICSVIALGVIIEKFLYFRKIGIDTGKFVEEISASLKRNKIMEAISKCEETAVPVAGVLKAGILKYDRTRQEMREAIEEAGVRQIPKLEKNVGILATITQVSPLLGLLGTVIGMVEIFQQIQQKSAALNPVTPAELSQGIWQALIATVAGLTVAIPALTAYNYFVSKVNNLILEMEISASDLIDILLEKKGE